MERQSWNDDMKKIWTVLQQAKMTGWQTTMHCSDVKYQNSTRCISMQQAYSRPSLPFHGSFLWCTQVSDLSSIKQQSQLDGKILPFSNKAPPSPNTHH
jgi:hypothetical protein